MKFEITLAGSDAECHGEKLVLDLDRLDTDTDCNHLISWEEECRYTLHLIKVEGVRQPTRWRQALVWFALKQSGSDLAFTDLVLRATGALRVIGVADVDPPDETSSEDRSEPVS